MLYKYVYIYVYIYIQWNIIQPGKTKKSWKSHHLTTTWVNPEGTVLSEIEKDKYCISLCGTWKSEVHRNRGEWWLPEARGRKKGEMLVKGHKLLVVR